MGVGWRTGFLRVFAMGKLARTEIYKITCRTSPLGCRGALVNYVDDDILYFRCWTFRSINGVGWDNP